MALTGKIMDFFADKAMTIPAFPRTKVKAVSDDDGIGLNVLLDNLQSKLGDTSVSEQINLAIANKADRVLATTITLMANNWVNNSQTVSVAGVTADNKVLTTHAPSGYVSYTGCGVRMDSQNSNSITFLCETVPSEDIAINVMILG